jgi:hypothetical protein
MPIIDFKEIPSSKGGEHGQDLWALFAREYFEALHFIIEQGPDRGPDSGRDLIIVENREGILGSSKHKWLVSCKHYAHSDTSVSNKDEIDILGRINKFEANGFIAFYSTIPSSELSRTLEAIKKKFEVEVFDREKTERSLLENVDLKRLFERFFPISFKEYYGKFFAPKNIFDTQLKIKCNLCGKDLSANRDGIVCFGNKIFESNDEFKENDKIEIIDMYWSCRGRCDSIMESEFRNRGMLTTWEEFGDLAIPMVFMRWVIAMMNRLRGGVYSYSDEAYEKYLEFTLAMAQLVVKETSQEDRQRIETLTDIPQSIGGLSEWGMMRLKYIDNE